MADMAADYDDLPRPARRSAMAVLGAVCAASVLWGISSWGYGLLTRDAGQIPFLRADEGPMKTLPEDPGGLKLARADMAVTRMISGADPAEETLAPGAEPLTDEDLPAPYLSEAAPGQGASADEAEPEENPIDAAVARVLAEQASAPSAPSVPAAFASDPDSHAPAAAPILPARPSPGSVPRATPAPAAAPRTASLASGDVAIQLGAFNTEAIAESQWKRHLARNEDLLQDLAHAVTTVESGGRTLYRLRVGPMPDRDRAADLCAALKARGDACIVATVR